MSDLLAPDVVRSEPLVDWRAVSAGAVIAAGVSTTLLAFGSAIGLSVASASPNWRDSTVWLWLVSGLFLILVALASFGSAGYVAGRMRMALRKPGAKEVEFRDGMHGLITWGLAIVLSALLALGAAMVGAQTVRSGDGNAGASASAAGETLLAAQLDRLFRTDRTAAPADLAYRRSEAARILMKSSDRNGVVEDERAYLATVVARVTGDRDAGARVDQAVADSKDAIHRARVAAVLQAFMIAAALLAGAAIAWFCATEGGRDRELETGPVWDWSVRRRRVV